MDSIFVPRHVARQLGVIFLLQATLMTWKTLSVASNKLTARMRKEWRMIKQVRRHMRKAGTYAEWRKYAELADQLQGNEAWRKDPECTFYDRETLQHRIDELTDLINKGDIFQLMFTLRGGIYRSQYGMLHEGLFSKALSGTKLMVEQYLETVCKGLRLICDADSSGEGICTDTKLAFFNESRHAFGRTALLLSGGAAMGIYHLGVVKALLNEGLLPRVVSGASAGSIVAALVGTRTNAELPQLYVGDIVINFFKYVHLRNGPITEQEKRRSSFRDFLLPSSVQGFGSNLHAVFMHNIDVLRMDTDHFRAVMRHNIGNFTFQEAFDRTGRIINITVSPINQTDPPRLLNYLTSPHILVWSAAVCSSAVPGIFDASYLLVKDPDGSIRPESSTGLRFCDGSIEADLPMEQLAELFNINHFVISQVNPHACLLSNLSMNRSIWVNPLYGFVTGLLGFLKAQMRSWAKHMVELIILRRQAPSWSTRRGVGQLLTQEYVGRDSDITILPWQGYESIPGAALKLLTNPSKERYKQMVIGGERNTFPYIERVRNHCAIEMSLEESVKKLRQRLAAERDQDRQIILRNRDRTPSFYTDRTPSFYTSPSLVGLSGLAITDPAKTTTGLLPATQGKDSVPLQTKTKDTMESSRNNPYSIPYHTQVAGTDHVKTASMANFYYRRTKSQSFDTAGYPSVLQTLQKNTSKSYGENLDQIGQDKTAAPISR